jgi:hypothetical protein
MVATIKNLRETGYTGLIQMNFHVYQFNILNELREAAEWCDRGRVPSKNGRDHRH